jgi:putative alpha-1,2-mannosidase
LITDSISVVGQAGQNCGFLSSLGFYPVNPATGEFVLGAPQVKKARLHLKNHKMFTIEASNFSLENIYQEKPKLNDAEIVKPTISYHQIISGGTLHFLMKDK